LRRVQSRAILFDVLQEPVAIQITRGTLDAIAARHPRWKTSEAVWEEFRKWTGGRGKEVGLSYEDRPPFFYVGSRVNPNSLPDYDESILPSCASVLTSGPPTEGSGSSLLFVLFGTRGF
jgi:hypothetical protein